MKTLAKQLTEKLEIRDEDSNETRGWKAFGQGALDGAIVVGAVTAGLGCIKIIRRLTN